MNLPVPKYNTDPLNFHFLLEDSSDGQVLGTIAELPGCQVTAATQEEAIDELQRMTRDRLAKMTVVPFSMAAPPEVEQKKNPWLKYMGMYEGDADFAAIAAELRAARGLEELSWEKRASGY
jgi:hypothetical protein